MKAGMNVGFQSMGDIIVNANGALAMVHYALAM